MKRLLLVLLLAILVWTPLAVPSGGCPFCTAEGQTLTKEINLAPLVIFGKIHESKGGVDFSPEGSTEFIVEKVIKRHDILNKALTKQEKLGGKETLTLARPMPFDKEKYKFVVFCDVFQGKIDPYKVMAVGPTGDPCKYLLGALEVKDKQQPERLKFFFKYLDDSEPDVATDAYKEFAYADYKDYQGIAKDLPADKIAGWLSDEKTPSFRLGLYASLLGHCGNAQHAGLLRKLLEEPTRRSTSGVEGIMAGFIMLNKKDGWDFLRNTLRDEKRDFSTRYTALRAARFFHDFRPDLIDKKDVVEAVSALLDQPDVADLAIEDLRKWQVWDLADRILALKDKDSHNIPIIKRSILRYALDCPKDGAKAFVEARRKADPDAVQNSEELLKLEKSPPTLSQPTPAAKSK
jgi:hypothetical protein